MARKQTLRYVIKHKLIDVIVGQVTEAKKTFVTCKHVVKKIVAANLAPHLERQNIQVSQFFVFEILVAIVCLMIIKV